MAIQVWIENARAVTLSELLELVPNSVAKKEVDELRGALISCARQAEALKRDCGMDPESNQAIRNAEYQSISTTAHIALGTMRGAKPEDDQYGKR